MLAHLSPFTAFLLSLIVTSHLWGAESDSHWPEPGPGEIVVMTVTPQQVASLIPLANFENPETRNGVCFGIDRLNFALLTRIRFSNTAEKADSLPAISAKLTAAAMGERTLTIHGYDSLSEFIAAMEKLADAENPLRAAIVAIHQTQAETVSLSPGAIKALDKADGTTLREQASKMQTGIDGNIPQSVSISDDEGRHSLTIVGYRRYQTSSQAHDFFAIDSNHPRTLQRLSLKLTSENAGFQWYYHPWQANKASKIPNNAARPETPPWRRGLRYSWWYSEPRLSSFYGGSFYSWYHPSRFNTLPVTGGEVVIQIHSPTERVARTAQEVFRRTVRGHAETDPKFEPLRTP